MPNPDTTARLYERITSEHAEQYGAHVPVLSRLGAEMPEQVDRHPAATYLITTQTAMSRATALSTLNIVARLLGEKDIRSTPWHLIRYHHMSFLRATLADHYAPATANKIISMVRSVLRQAWKLGMMDTDSYKRAVAIPGIQGSRLPAGRALDPAEVRALFEACAEPGPNAARDAALLAILIGCGLRRSEAANLDLEDLDTENATLRIVGKGNHERLAHMNSGVEDAVNAWLKIRGKAEGPLLYAITGRGDHIIPRRLCTESIRLILQRRGEQARIRSCTPHDLRRTFITSLLDAGNDIAVTSRLAGHRNITTTTRYDRRDERANQKAAATIHVPYQPPVDQVAASTARKTGNDTSASRPEIASYGSGTGSPANA